MSSSEDSIVTAYGRLDKSALAEVQTVYDPRVLLDAVAQLDAFIIEARGNDGLRDMLLKLHGMAHHVVNGAALTVSTDEETLPELALDTASEIHELIAMLQQWIKRIEPLQELHAGE